MATLHNKGQREIQYDGGILKPNEYAEIDDKIAKNLLRLFGEELTEIKSNKNTGGENGSKEPTKADLLVKAAELKLEISDKATKADLIATIEAAGKAAAETKTN